METSAARKTNVPEFSAAYYFLEGLKEIGVDYLFCNFGTDHAPIIDEMAHRKKLGAPMPGVVRCPHENTAAHMAGGYALVTGRGQGVLVHVDVGTANTGNGMHNLFRSRLPVLLMAGKAPYTVNNELVGSRDTYVHFIQEPFDQASLVRPYLKWEWTLPSGIVVKEALQRASSIMQSEPRGPVYLMMQRETLTQTFSADEIRSYSADQFAATAGGGADPKLVETLADRLLTAENPTLITGYAGRHAHTSRAIDALAQFAGIAVYEVHGTNNISHDSPCFVGFSAEKAVPKTDVGLLVDVDVPWFPSKVQAAPNAFWAHIDIDTLKPGSPMWSFPGNTRMQGDSGRILEQVLDVMKAKATPRFKAAAAERLTRVKAAREERIAHAAKLAADKGKPGAINPHYLTAELAKLIGDEDMIFNEGITNSAAVFLQIPRRLPNTTIVAGGGGLGWSGGMALGAKLAAPDRLMVQISGDGGFYFGNPTSTLAIAQQYKLPYLSIVLDNSGWNAVKQSTLRVYPEGEAKTANSFESELAPNVHFAKVGEAFGAYAEEISEPADVPAALARCIKEVRGGRAALLHARVTKM
jgi:acetolactate synthase I/II/III large subunit